MTLSLNKTIISGRPGHTLELVSMRDKVVCNFNFAHDGRYVDKQGKVVEKTIWVKCTCWGASAENLVKLVNAAETKPLLVIEGSLDYDTYDKDGVKFKVNPIYVERWQFAEPRKTDGAAAATTEQPPF